MIAAAARQIDSILHPGAEDTGCTEQALRLAEKIVAAAPDINVDRSEYLDRHVDHVAEILHRSVYQSLVLDDTPFTDHQHAASEILKAMLNECSDSPAAPIGEGIMNEPIELTSTLTAELERAAGDDEYIVDAMRVSTISDGLPMYTDAIQAKLNWLAKNGHNSPFEHGWASFKVSAPIFVAREWMRHRTLSYNEQSARYARMRPVFYVPDMRIRGVINTQSSARPLMALGESTHRQIVGAAHEEAFTAAWRAYEEMLNAGVANEVARDVLPVATYTSFYASGNLRAWLQFLDLRQRDPRGRNYPQYEITVLADQVRGQLEKWWPMAVSAWMGAKD